jgi:hypothetical protein
MATWGDFARAAPAVAEHGRQLLYRTGQGSALLTTVRGDGLPRLHPITVAVVDDRLVAFIIRDSPKATDLSDDGRYALHSHVDLQQPHEFSVRGYARPVDDPDTRAAIAADWPFQADDSYRLFEFLVGHAVAGERPTPRDWPPRYTSWRAQPV